MSLHVCIHMYMWNRRELACMYTYVRVEYTCELACMYTYVRVEYTCELACMYTYVCVEYMCELAYVYICTWNTRVSLHVCTYVHM